MKYLKRFNENLDNNSDKIHIPEEYSGVRMELGEFASPQDIIDTYNQIVEEEVPLVSYSEDGFFTNEDTEEIEEFIILDELNYAIVGEEEDNMGDLPKQKRFGDGNENEIYLTNNVRFHRKGNELTLSYTPTKIGGGLRISDEQKKMLIDFLTKN